MKLDKTASKWYTSFASNKESAFLRGDSFVSNANYI